MRNSAGRRPSVTNLAVLVSVSLFGLLGLGWLWATRYRPLHAYTHKPVSVIDAERGWWILPALWIGVALIAAIWFFAARAGRWNRRWIAGPLVVVAIALIAAVASGVMANLQHQSLAFDVKTCSADAWDPTASRTSLPDCAERSDPVRVTLGTAKEPAKYSSDESASGSASLNDLPIGMYDARVSVSVPMDVAGVELARQSGEYDVQVASFRPGAVNPDGTREWVTSLPFQGNGRRWSLLLYSSPYVALPRTQMTFTVMSCTKGDAASFDPSSCAPASPDDNVLDENSAEWSLVRPVAFSRENNVVTVSNLEARVYSFSPVQPTVLSSMSQRKYVIVPAVGDQKNLLQVNDTDHREELRIELKPDSPTQNYIIYVFTKSDGYAGGPMPIWRVT